MLALSRTVHRTGAARSQHRAIPMLQLCIDLCTPLLRGSPLDFLHGLRDASTWSLRPRAAFYNSRRSIAHFYNV